MTRTGHGARGGGSDVAPHQHRVPAASEAGRSRLTVERSS